jgi:hypothetical protein
MGVRILLELSYEESRELLQGSLFLYPQVPSAEYEGLSVPEPTNGLRQSCRVQDEDPEALSRLYLP